MKLTVLDRFPRWCALTLLVVTSVLVILTRLPDFDGSFNTQAAINLYRNGTLLLDYASPYALQTHLPFQLLNGLFLTLLGPTFLAFNIANVVCYFGLFALCERFARKTESQSPYWVFCLISLYPNVYLHGFAGFGEVPGLVCILWGITVLLEDSALSVKRALFGGVIIGVGCSIKLILWGALLPLIIVIALFADGTRWRRMLFGIGGALCCGALFWTLQYKDYPGEPAKILSSVVVAQSRVHNAYSIASYAPPDNIIDKVSQYLYLLVEREGELVALTFLLVPLLVVVLYAGLFSQPASKSTLRYVYLYIALYALGYFLWYLCFNTRPWDRRYLNAAILALLSFIPCCSSPKMFGRVVCALTGVFLTFLWAPSYGERILCVYREGADVHYEQVMRSALQRLPQDYVAFGYHNREAPRWSFVAQKKFLDLLNNSLLEGDLHGVRGPYYLFLDKSSGSVEHILDAVLAVYDVREVWHNPTEPLGDRIVQIMGVKKPKAYVSAEKIVFTSVMPQIFSRSSLSDQGLQLGGTALVYLKAPQSNNVDIRILARSVVCPSAPLYIEVTHTGGVVKGRYEVLCQQESVITVALPSLSSDNVVAVHLKGGMQRESNIIEQHILVHEIGAQPHREEQP
jgi:hypothetical protein